MNYKQITKEGSPRLIIIPYNPLGDVGLYRSMIPTVLENIAQYRSQEHIENITTIT